MREDSLDAGRERKVEEIRKDAEDIGCSVQRALYFIREFIEGPMCGKCYPCAFGTAEAKIRLMRITGSSGHADDSDIEALKRIGAILVDGSFCKKGKDAGRFIVELAAASGEEFREHLSGVCPKKQCVSLVDYAIRPELCSMCGKCAEVCKYGAIIGEKKKRYLSGYLPFEIRQRRCTKCGDCLKVCPEGAIRVVGKREEALVDRE